MEKATSKEVLYRFESYRTGYGDEDGFCHIINIRLVTYDIIKKTECGVWIRTNNCKYKFVNLKSKKKFACVSIEDAKISYIKRKEMQIVILESCLKDAKAGLYIAEHGNIMEGRV